jgi:hypothetical protein
VSKLLKISMYLFAFAAFFMLQSPASAAEKLTNSNGIKISEEEYANLKELGFTELAIDQMGKDVFKEHSKLKVDSKNSVSRYYEIKETPQYFTLLSAEENANYLSTELSEEEYFKRVEASKNSFQTFSSDTSSTYYRRLTTQIQKIGSEIRLHNNFIWDVVPNTRSYDVLTVSIDNFFSPIVGTQYGQQLWSYTTPTGGFYGDNAVYSSASSTWNKQSAGYGVKMNLKDDEVNLKVTELEGYMYYKIGRNSSIVPTYINAYGNYSHAKSTVSSSLSYGLDFGGPSISWSGASSTDFDALTTHAQTTY